MDYETRVSKLIALHFSGLITECEEEELQNLLRENPTTATLFPDFVIAYPKILRQRV